MRFSNHVYLLGGDSYDELGNVYAIDAPEGLILIDCGVYTEALDTIEENLAQYHLENKPIALLMLTHAHYDHAGNVRHFYNKGAKILCGQSDAQTMVEAGGVGPPLSPFTQWYPAAPVDFAIAQDCNFAYVGIQFTIYTLPGHSKGSLGFGLHMDGKHILFTGDTVCAYGYQIGEALLGWKGSPDYSAEDYMQSLQKLALLSPDMVLGGHGMPCLKNGAKVLVNAAQTGLLTLR